MRVGHRGGRAVLVWRHPELALSMRTAGVIVVLAMLATGPAAAAGPAFAVTAAARLMAVGHLEAHGSVSDAGLRFRPGDGFGSAVALSGSVAVVGAPGVRNSSGAAEIFARSGGRWRLQATLHNPGHAAAEFGNAVAVSGTTVAIAAWAANGNRGAVYVYVRSGTRWHKQARLSENVPAPCSTCGHGDYGNSVAISGNVLVISAYLVSDFSGAVFIYARSASGKWHRQARLVYPGRGSPPVEFGDAVAASDTTVAVAALQAKNDCGQVFLYTRAGNSWRRRATLTGSRNLLFGASVALSRTRLAVGAFSTTRNRARGYVFAESGSRWRRQGFLTSPPGKPSDAQYFTAVAISGTRALVGDPRPNPHQCGAAYEYALDGGRWRVRAKLVNPGCAAGDQFGLELALSGQTGVIGAPGYHQGARVAYVQVLP